MNDIEILEDYIKKLKLTPEELLKNNEIIKFIEYKEIQAIENLINRVKELEEEIKRMKSIDYYKVVEDIETGQYIPKSKIKEKIEEVDKYGDCETGSPPLYKTKKGIKIMKEDAELILQELLEEE